MIEIWKEKIFYETADIKVIYDGETYNLHKQNLFNSPVLRSCVSSDFKERLDNYISLDKDIISKNGWENILNCIYQKYAEVYKSFNIEVNCNNFSIKGLTLDDKIELYIASDYFGILTIKDELNIIFNHMLERMIPNDEIVQNILKILEISDKTNDNMEIILQKNSYMLFYFIIKCMQGTINYYEIPWKVLNKYDNIKQFNDISELYNKILLIKDNIKNLLSTYCYCDDLNLNIICLNIIINPNQELYINNLQIYIEKYIKKYNKIYFDNNTTSEFLAFVKVRSDIYRFLG